MANYERFDRVVWFSVVGAVVGGLVGAISGYSAMRWVVADSVAAFGSAPGEVGLMLPIFSVLGLAIGALAGAVAGFLWKRRSRT